MEKNYRLGVVGVFIDQNGDVLVCERSNRRGVWQFPQGGVDEGESVKEALMREMLEELGTSQFSVVAAGEELTQYDFPPEADFALAREFTGQRHHWFQLRFEDGKGPDLDKSDGEFADFRWCSPRACLDTVVSWKLGAYQAGLSMLGIKWQE